MVMLSCIRRRFVEGSSKDRRRIEEGRVCVGRCSLLAEVFVAAAVPPDAEARRGLHRLAHGKVGAHAEEEGEDHVVDENRLDKYVNVVHEYCVNASDIIVQRCPIVSAVSLCAGGRRRW